MAGDVELGTECAGGCCAGFLRCCLAGESCYFNRYTVGDNVPSDVALDVVLAPKMPGEVILVDVVDETREWRVQQGSYLGGDEGVQVNVAFNGCCGGCFSGEGCFVLKLQGQGRALLNTYGAAVRYDLSEGEVRTVDNGALVAWSSEMEYKIGLASKKGGMLSRAVKSFASGEGIVLRFTGPGTLYVQTRSFAPLIAAIEPYLPSNKKPAGPADTATIGE
eukprot:CAMPEP_0170158360 /NCGR_PEP_ID=MMETSP0033_2-20121228/68094_1 /TAXON_ID=195969 /ORGANISM="Dolichomastix tenuilepis, Strain CCMP3274" /LENGTH=219 /DNA_ID=CAMNT_0010395795 /DNA_START=125 /DNA_END=784 /DNA_ORIENTATION=-